MGVECEGAPILFLTHIKLFNFDPPDRGGVSDTVPSPQCHTRVYIEPKTGDSREPSPPVIYKAERRG